jgi:hypothetical protein
MRKTVGFFDMLTVACLIAPAPFFWMPPLWITALMMPRHGGADTGTAAGTRNCLGPSFPKRAVSGGQGNCQKVRGAGGKSQAGAGGGVLNLEVGLYTTRPNSESVRRRGVPAGAGWDATLR